jgi:hypothetical protein
MAGVLTKLKRPHGTQAWEYVASDTDGFGQWLYLPRGAAWTAPHDRGVLPFDVLALVAPTRPWVAWWCDDGADRRIEIDVCLPPVEVDAGWSFVDLELDVMLHADGSLVVEDEDEFADARLAGHIDPATAALAEAACTDAVALLGSRGEPFGEAGWRRLTDQR